MENSTEEVPYQNRNERICEFCDAPVDNSMKPRGWNRHNYFSPILYEMNSQYTATVVTITYKYSFWERILKWLGDLKLVIA